MKEKFTLKKILTNSSWMVGQQVYFVLLQLVIGSLSARYLGASNYGVINYGASIITFFVNICKLGLDNVIINEMIINPNKKGSLLGSALVMRLLTSVASFFLIVSIVKFLEPTDTMLQVVTALQGIAVILQTYEVFTYWFQLNLKMKYVSLAIMLAQTIVGVWRIILLASKASIYFFALSSSIQHFVCGIVIIVFFIKEKNGLKLKFDKNDSYLLLSKSYHFIISGIAITFYSQIDRIMIGKIINAEAVGYYTAANIVALTWEFVPNALISSARPIVIQTREDEYDDYFKRFQQLVLVVTLLSLVFAVGMTIFGKLAVHILYGSSYDQAVLPLCILTWSAVFAMIGTAREIWIVAEGYNKYTKYYIIIGAIVNFVLNCIAIPRWGIAGASVTTLISQITVALISPLLFKKTREFDIIFIRSFKQFPEIVRIIKKFVKDYH